MNLDVNICCNFTIKKFGIEGKTTSKKTIEK